VAGRGKVENLSSFGSGKRSVDEERKMQSKGGKNSGKTRQALVDFRKEILDFYAEDPSRLRELIIGLHESGAKGNHNAAAFMRDTIGQKPSDKVESKVQAQVVYGWED
jgi:hypothetical protein